MCLSFDIHFVQRLNERAHPDIVTKMLEYEGNINALDANGESGLFNAIKIKDLKLIQFLLLAQINTNIQNPQGETVLELLVYTGMEHSGIIKLLISHGIDPKLKNKKGQTIFEVLTKAFAKKEVIFQKLKSTS